MLAVRRADVLLGVGVQPEHRDVERGEGDKFDLFLRLDDRAGGLLQEGHLLRVGGDAASGVPDVELALDMHSEVRMSVTHGQ